MTDPTPRDIGATVGSSFLVLTGHDYRAARRANMHFIARELSTRGMTRMFSLGFSPLSTLRGRDPRNGQDIRRNVTERHQGVDCYLWWTIAHPFNLRSSRLASLEKVFFELYCSAAPKILQEWARAADTICVESGLPVLFIPLLRKWNPQARIIYIASDDLTTIQCAPYLSKVFFESALAVDGARVPSALLEPAIPLGIPVFHVPHGIDALDADESPSPYRAGLNAVSVGSMLFDPDFFHRATSLFPDIKFHVIGAGKPSSALPANVEVYPEMPHRQTIPFIKYADFAIAPYKNAALPYYLADTSMKLMQYGYLGVPAVCPSFAVGGATDRRFGYEPGDSSSIFAAITSALEAGPSATNEHLSWSDVTDRILEPWLYPEIALRDTLEGPKARPN